MSEAKKYRSPEWHEKQRLAHLGKQASYITKQKMSIAHTGEKNGFYGKTHTEETKSKIRQSRIGKPLSDETKKKISIAESGENNWNFGKHLPEEQKKILSEKMKGNTNALGSVRTEEQRWHYSLAPKGKPMLGKHHTPETKLKLSIASNKNKEVLRQINLGNKYGLGHHHSEESKKKMSDSKKGIKREPFSEEWCKKLGLVNKGKHREFSEEWKNNMSIAHKDNPKVIKNLRIIMKNVHKISKPQKELYLLLKQIFADATLEYPIKVKDGAGTSGYRFANIAVPSLKLDFEYDGVHWHKDKLRDIIRDKELAEIGWATFRIRKEALKILASQKIFVLKRIE
jgi:very-short-patch-repair endonuclease